LLRRARLGIEGVVFDVAEFRILPDFGNNKVVMQDCFTNLHYVDWLQVMGGKFKEPVSFEEAFVLDRYVPTVERSIIDQITPARDIGVMIWGQELFGDQVDYYLSVGNGEINADVDTNKTKDFAGRIVWRPLNYEALPGYMRPIEIGISGSVGIEQEYLGLTGAGSTSAPTSGQTLQTSSKVTWLTFNAADYANGIRTRVVPEVSYFYGPFGMCAELMRMDQQIQIATTNHDRPQDVRFDGFMVTATYMLTGEYHKAWGFFRPNNAFDPTHPFSHPGAWELVGAVSRLRVDSGIFQDGLASATGNSDGATEVTFGFNWYPNGFVKVQLNWEHAIFDQAVTLNTASGTMFRNSNTLMTRLQLAF
jgi:phosphate-selective porin OprO/OprP